MNSADQNSQTLVYADGYSYTEIFQAPEMPGVPGGTRLISVFHAFFTSDHDRENENADLLVAAPPLTEIAGGI